MSTSHPPRPGRRNGMESEPTMPPTSHPQTGPGDDVEPSSTIFINIIDVDPAHHDRLLELVNRGLDEVVRQLPGFESATVLSSVDRARVVNIARWRNAADAAAARSDSRSAAFAQQIAELGTATPGVYLIARACANRTRS